MSNPTFGGYRNANAFVAAKLKRLEASPATFGTLFELMFSERGNVFYERNAGLVTESFTYGEVHDRILRRAAVLREKLSGLPQDTAVGLHLDNSLDFLELFWAILCAGFRPLLLNKRLETGLLLEALADAGAGAVISRSREFPLPAWSPEEIGTDASPLSGIPFGTELMVMSSGTSLHVKVCAYGAEEFFELIRDSARIIRKSRLIKKHYRGRLKHLAFLPFYHVFGLIAMILWFGFFSRTFVELPDLTPRTILTTIRRHEVTHIFAVPLFWETVYREALKTIRGRGEKTLRRFEKGMRIAAALEKIPPLGRLFSRIAFREVRENLFGESVLFMITGGSSVRPEVLAFFNRIGYPLANGYGMTEIGITSVELSGKASERNRGLIGAPMTSVRYRIAADGELLVSGKALARRILEDGREIPRQEWFATGDLAAEEDGRYRILGRKDDLVVDASGENLNPEQIEPLFDKVPGLGEACLTCRSENGKTLPVLVISAPDLRSEEERKVLEEQIREVMDAHRLTGRIPRLTVTAEKLRGEDDFKLNRRKVREALAAGKLKEYRKAPENTGAEPEDALRKKLRELFAEALDRKPEEIRTDADFFRDENGTSLDFLALLARLEEEEGLKLPAELPEIPATVDAMADYIRGL